LKGKSITVAEHETPTFVVVSSHKVGLGGADGLGGAADASAQGGASTADGKQIEEEDQLQDPAPKIGEGIASDLAAFKDLTMHDSHGAVAKSTDPADLVRQYTGSDLILDVQTVDWWINDFATDWMHYRVFYRMKVRLIRTADSSVLAEGVCMRGNEQTAADAPTFEELLADHAVLLKQHIANESQSCVQELKGKVLVL